MSRTAPKRLLILFGNQLFPLQHIEQARPSAVFIAESEHMCRHYAAHRHKLVLILSAMRSKADPIAEQGHEVFYAELNDAEEHSWTSMLEEHLDSYDYDELVCFECESPTMTSRVRSVAEGRGLSLDVVPSPMFLTSREEFREYRNSHKRLFMADFYRGQRKRLGVLLEADGTPTGGQWSFDEDNRKKLPKGVTPPEIPEPEWTAHTREVVALVDERFPDHPGDAKQFWLPTTESQAEHALQTFLDERFALFGNYEDALSSKHPFVFHSVLSPLLNVGLLTPRQVLDAALEKAGAEGIPLNALEGFVRQVIGWREFIRGVWNTLPPEHWEQNYWNHTRQLADCWYDATTGIPPLDDAISRAAERGYCHHIERLMVLGNMMLLCRIAPDDAYRWFMEMFVDSADWVMAPNVYGMALFSEGGAFTTKPYICGSNYLRKMSDYPKGEWCDVVDGVYWSFVSDHRGFFEKNPRSKMMTRTLDRLDADRKDRIFARAQEFIERVTR